MKAKLFLRLGALLLWVLAPLGSLRADGFIIVREPVPSPIGHFTFAPMEVTYHHVEAKIVGQICTTTVDQEFYNPNNRVMEGTYLFPIPKTAQIEKFSMEIGGKQMEAELLSATKAREIYEDIVRKQLDPALMEYGDRGAFKVRIFPIEPNSRKRVKIVYSELLKADAGLFGYTYPLNTEKFSAAPVKSVSIKVEIKSSDPISSIYSPTHDVEIKREGSDRAVAGFEEKNTKPDRDFQLFFSVNKGVVATNLLTYRTGDGDGYFLLLASPNVEAKAKPMPKDVMFVLDTSGSMAEGNKMKQARKALQYCLANLNADDRFEVVRFSTEAEPFFGKLVAADEAARDKASKFVDELKPRGGTAINDALRSALAMRPAQSDRPFVMIFLTDGQPTVGLTKDDAIVATTEKAAKEGARIFCFGMGNDVNSHLLDRISEQSRAVSDYVLPEEDIEIKVSNFFAKIREPVLADIRVTFPDGVRVTKMEPAAVPDLFKGSQLVLTGRYNGSGEGNVTIEGTADGEKKSFATPVTFPKQSSEHLFVARLWASRRVAFLLDQIRLNGESAELKTEVADLAREFALVTPYTAFLITEDEKSRNVTSRNQVMRTFADDREAQASAGASYSQLRSDKAGESAVATARAQNTMKHADRPEDSLSQSNAEIARGMGAAVPAASMPRAKSAPAPAEAKSRVVQYAQNTRYLNGRSFFQNGEQWVDGNVSKQNSAKNVTLKFGSPEYFVLLAKFPEANAYFSLGQNVKVLLDETIYEITPDGKAS